MKEFFGIPPSAEFFTYNSLDPSSKFYTENEVDQNGKVLSAFDESGDHKTVFDYERDGVTVKTERLPNGSKFSYGRDKDGAVTAITHSTENGEENSTTQLRTLDMVTEVKSGNNTVRYAYDKKRRVKAVSLNGVDDYVTYNYSGEHTDAEKVTATMADGTTVTTTKNAHGNVTKSTIGNKTVTNTYDADQKLTKTVDSVSGETSLTYDDKGKVISVIAPDHSESFVYDDKDVVTNKTVDAIAYAFAYKATADKALTDLFSVAFYGGSFGTWEDYAIAFTFGGLSGGLGNIISNGGRIASALAQGGKFVSDILLRPAANQAVKMGTRGTSFNKQKLYYDAIMRSVTYFGTPQIVKGNVFGYDIKVDFGKSFNRATPRYMYTYLRG